MSAENNNNLVPPGVSFESLSAEADGEKGSGTSGVDQINELLSRERPNDQDQDQDTVPAPEQELKKDISQFLDRVLSNELQYPDLDTFLDAFAQFFGSQEMGWIKVSHRDDTPNLPAHIERQSFSVAEWSKAVKEFFSEDLSSLKGIREIYNNHLSYHTKEFIEEVKGSAAYKNVKAEEVRFLNMEHTLKDIIVPASYFLGHFDKKLEEVLSREFLKSLSSRITEVLDQEDIFSVFYTMEEYRSLVAHIQQDSIQIEGQDASVAELSQNLRRVDVEWKKICIGARMGSLLGRKPFPEALEQSLQKYGLPPKVARDLAKLSLDKSAHRSSNN